MKRTPLKPGKRLTRNTPLRAKSAMPKPLKPMAKRNQARARKRWEEAFGEKRHWIVSLSCACKGWDDGFCDRVVAAHWKSRGAGGTSADLIPLCDRHHGEQHTLGVQTFAARYPKVDFPGLAERLEALWQEMQRREAA